MSLDNAQVKEYVRSLVVNDKKAEKEKAKVKAKNLMLHKKQSLEQNKKLLKNKKN